ncbi:hypothetical protein B7939_01290 [Eggerthia catenaformis]|nr:hypothetical protein B7939_01290 [Eggerthia catenaformis]
MMTLRNALSVMDSEKSTTAVRYTDASNMSYAFNGMPGCLSTILRPNVLSAEVTRISKDGEYLLIDIKDPNSAANTDK